MLDDIQASRDDRELPLDEVGIAGIRYPVAVGDREHGKQDTIADVRMSASLPPDVRGAHLSRFVQFLHETAREITPQALPAILAALRARLGSAAARIEASFPLFVRRRAPVTGAVALLDYQCWLAGEITDAGVQIMLGVRVPVTSVCPCSKAISDYGAHNQRATIAISACLHCEEGRPANVQAEELIDVAEAAASCPVYPVLKRTDERHVTMRAYDHPVFVEDMVRSVVQTLRRDPRLDSFTVEAVSEESIHNHRAYARWNRQRSGAVPRNVTTSVL